MEKLFSAKELSALVGWDRATIYRKSKELPGAIRLGKRTLRFRESAIREWISGNEESHDRGVNDES
jgi:predicted DNA-binding transcriptional regulator AlpA